LKGMKAPGEYSAVYATFSWIEGDNYENLYYQVETSFGSLRVHISDCHRIATFGVGNKSHNEGAFGLVLGYANLRPRDNEFGAVV
jgi:hypothetical protein